MLALVCVCMRVFVRVCTRSLKDTWRSLDTLRSRCASACLCVFVCLWVCGYVFVFVSVCMCMCVLVAVVNVLRVNGGRGWHTQPNLGVCESTCSVQPGMCLYTCFLAEEYFGTRH